MIAYDKPIFNTPTIDDRLNKSSEQINRNLNPTRPTTVKRAVVDADLFLRNTTRNI